MHFNYVVTESNEVSIASRNATKMKYLLKENRHLKEQVKDYQNIVSLNKETLRVAYNNNLCKSNPQLTTPKTQNSMDTAISNNNGHLEDNISSQSQRQIEKLMEENDKLAKFLEKTINERNQLQYTALIYEQIVEQNCQFEEEIVKEYEEKVEAKKIQQKTMENIIHELEILKSIPLDLGDVEPDTYIIFRDVLSPHNLFYKLQNKVEQLEKRLSEEILAVRRTSIDLDGERKRNLYLATEMRKLRALMNYWPSKNFQRRHLSVVDVDILAPDQQEQLDNFQNAADKNSSVASIIIEKGISTNSRRSQSNNSKVVHFNDKISHKITDSRLSNAQSIKNNGHNSRSPSYVINSKSKSPLKKYSSARKDSFFNSSTNANFIDSSENKRFLKDRSNYENLVRDNKLQTKKITVQNNKSLKMKEEIRKAKNLLLYCLNKEKTLHDTNRKLVETNFGLKKTLKVFENYFYNSMEKSMSKKFQKKDRFTSLPQSLTDIFYDMKRKYNTDAYKNNKRYKQEVLNSYEIFNSIQLDSGMGFNWTPQESPKGNVLPNLFTKDPNFPKGFDYNKFLTNKDMNGMNDSYRNSNNLDSMIMDCQSVQRNMKFKKRQFMNSYLESQDGNFVGTPPMMSGDYANSNQLPDNFDDGSEKDLRFDVPLSGELIIDNEDQNSDKNIEKLIHGLEQRQENSNEKFTLEDCKIFLRDLAQDLSESRKNKYKFTFEKMKSGPKNVDFNLIPSFKAKIYRSQSTPNLFYKTKSSNIFNLDQTIQFEKMPYKNVCPDFSQEVEFDDFNNILTKGNKLNDKGLQEKKDKKNSDKQAFEDVNSFKDYGQDNYETPKLTSYRKYQIQNFVNINTNNPLQIIEYKQLLLQ